ncbi:MAG: serine--tRNA ligase [Holophagaceae bacterium]
MLDPHILRDHLDDSIRSLHNRHFDFDRSVWTELENARKKAIQALDHLKAERNKITELIRLRKQTQQDPSDLLEQQKASAETLVRCEQEVRSAESQWTDFLALIPNLPHNSVPLGPNAESNQEFKTWGTPRVIHQPQDHLDLAVALGIVDLERAAKISGSRFAVLKGLGAKLERALASFMLDIHLRKGYTEILPPYLVNAESMYGTGQLPKFENDLFKVAHGDTPLYLIPTAEVPVTNLYRNEILKESQLPIRHCALTPCFRSEAGSYGKDTKGIIRQHQFHKVELVSFVTEENAEGELERLTSDAESILEALELPYRRVLLCTGDMGFSSHKTYDLEVWLPSQNTYREISSCSWFGDFQARRASLKYRTDSKAKLRFLHTLNGSALAVGRTWVAILENGQQADGSILLPQALMPYMDGQDRITL